MANKPTDSPGMDAVAVNALLDIILKSAQAPHLKAIRETAMTELAQIEAEYEAVLRPPSPELEQVEGDV